MAEHDITINADGSLAYVYDDTLAEIFAGEEQETRRASHVEPAADYGIARTGWVADMAPSGGGVLVVGGELYGGRPFGFVEEPDPAVQAFATRQAALDAERKWLRRERGL